ncbi:tetratricopeptide repeat protein [Kribbella sp. NBC_00382]|uniref:tetratricopeptide repeat protein n=1 Tax=Kribbella sp. NBC_00382 TaxID=2975967 RepID=UPI002E1D288B
MKTTHFVDLYQVLQVPATAIEEEIRSAVTKQRRQWVKRQTSADPDRRTEAEARVRDIDRAEQVLLNQLTRQGFDRERAGQRPSEQETPGGEITGSWIDKAREYLLADNPGAANYAAREAIGKEGNDAEAWFLRAHSSFLLGNGRDAGYEFVEAIRLRPDSALYHYGFAEAFAAQEKWKEALVEYEHALRLDPGNPEYRTSIAVAYLQDDMAGRAVEIMESLVSEFPGTEVYKYYLGLALHDNALDSLGQIKPFVYNGRMVDAGGYAVVSEAQVRWVEAQGGRIRALKSKDPEIRRLGERLIEMAVESRIVRWNLDGSGPWIGAFILLGVIPFFAGFSGSAGAVFFGLVAGGLIAAIFTNSRRLPVWKQKLKSLTESGRLLRPGI